MKRALRCSASVLLAGPIAAFPADAEATAATLPENIVSTNVILDVFTWWNGEFERRITPNATVGASASFVTLDDEGDRWRYSSGNVFCRYYPQKAAPTRFFIGARLGIYRVSSRTSRDAGTSLGLGVDIGYTWRLGDGQRFALSLGMGAVRLTGGDLFDAPATLPTIRLVNVGLAF